MTRFATALLKSLTQKFQGSEVSSAYSVSSLSRFILKIDPFEIFHVDYFFCEFRKWSTGMQFCTPNDIRVRVQFLFEVM